MEGDCGYCLVVTVSLFLFNSFGRKTMSTNNIVGENFLQQIVGSYIGALVQREHLKNKRLDDFITTTGNYSQANLQSAIDRVNQRLGSMSENTGLNLGPSVEYGDMPRQLGVTPYPPPPSTLNVNEENNRSESHSSESSTKSQTNTEPKGEKHTESPRQEERSKQGEVYETRKESKKGFPWRDVLLGTALAAATAGNGYAAYKIMNMGSEPSQPAVQQPQQQQQPSVYSPSLNFNQEPGMGSVSIGVE